MMWEGLLSVLADVGKDIFANEAKNMLKESGITADAAKSIGQGDMSGAATSMFNQLPEIKAYNTLTSGASAGDMTRSLLPTALGTAEQNKAYASALQLPTQAAPQLQSSLPSYSPSAPYIGGGIEEILARQRGLLR